MTLLSNSTQVVTLRDIAQEQRPECQLFMALLENLTQDVNLHDIAREQRPMMLTLFDTAWQINPRYHPS